MSSTEEYEQQQYWRKSETHFKLNIDVNWFKKDEVITFKAQIIKAPKFNWYRKLLLHLGFSYKYEIKINDDES